MPAVLVDILLNSLIQLIILGGLLIFWYVNRDSGMPKNYGLRWTIVAVSLLLIVKGVGRWAGEQEGRMIPLQYAASCLEYMLVPTFLCLPISEMIPSLRKRWLLAVPELINVGVMLMAPFTDGLVFGFYDNGRFWRGPLGGFTYGVAAFYMAVALVLSARYYKRLGKGRRLILIYIVFITLLAAFLEYHNITGVLDNVILLDLFFYYAFLMAAFRMEISGQLVQRELELSQTRVRLMQEQIQPHFIFNSLYVIKALIRRNPDRAVEGIESFSQYLRSNLDALRSEKLIPFRKELEHIEAYVALELADETQRVDVRYDLEAMDFRLPALTVEPIGENAFRHGISGMARHGRVEILTRAEAGAVRVVVRDNGRGNDLSTERWQKSASTGIRNVRTRLEAQCGGTLTFMTGPEGTTAEIRIPLPPRGAGEEEAQ